MVKVNFPENYNLKDLAGKEAIFKCKIKKINEPIPAKNDDELAVKFSAKNLNELKTNIKERLSNEYESFSRSLLKKELMDEIEKRVKFDLPQSLIDSELTQIIQQNSKHSAEIKKDKVNEKKKILLLEELLWGYFLLKKVIGIRSQFQKKNIKMLFPEKR